MRAKTKLKSIVTTLPFFGLVLLLLLSPCKVRNYIQSELGVPQTEVSNKSKTTLSSSSCSSSETTQNSFVKKNYNPQHSPSPTSKFNFFLTPFKTHFLASHKARTHSSLSIPLYILYKNFKDYL